MIMQTVVMQRVLVCVMACFWLCTIKAAQQPAAHKTSSKAAAARSVSVARTSKVVKDGKQVNGSAEVKDAKMRSALNYIRGQAANGKLEPAVGKALREVLASIDAPAKLAAKQEPPAAKPASSTPAKPAPKKLEEIAKKNGITPMETIQEEAEGVDGSDV